MNAADMGSRLVFAGDQYTNSHSSSLNGLRVISNATLEL